MKAMVIKRETSVLGSKMFRGQIVDISKLDYEIYPDEFKIIKEDKRLNEEEEVNEDTKRRYKSSSWKKNN